MIEVQLGIVKQKVNININLEYCIVDEIFNNWDFNLCKISCFAQLSWLYYIWNIDVLIQGYPQTME